MRVQATGADWCFPGVSGPFQILGDAVFISTSTLHFFYLLLLIYFSYAYAFFFLAFKKNELVFASLMHLSLIVGGYVCSPYFLFTLSQHVSR